MLRETFYTRNQKYKKCSKNIYVVLLLIQIMSWCCIATYPQMVVSWISSKKSLFSFLVSHFYSFIQMFRKRNVLFLKKSQSFVWQCTAATQQTILIHTTPGKSWKYNKVRKKKIISNTKNCTFCRPPDSRSTRPRSELLE